MRNKVKYLMGNTIIFGIGSFGSKALTFLLIPLYTAVLSTAEYGLADLVYTSATLMVYVFTLNIADSELRFIIDDPDNTKGIFSYTLKVIAVGSSVCLIIIIGLRWFDVFNWPIYCYYLLFCYYFLMAINGAVTSYARAIDKVKIFSIAGVVMTLVMIICNLFFLLLIRIGLRGYLLASIIGVAASILYSCAALKLNIFSALVTFKCNLSIRKEMLRYSIPLIFNGIAWWINSAFDRYFVTAIRGVDQNGLYSAASKIPMIVATINSVFAQAWGLSAIRDIENDDKDGFFVKTYNAYNFMFVILSSVIIGLNIPVSKLLFAKEFYHAWKYSSVLMLSTLFSSLSSFLGGAFVRVKRTDIYAKTTVASSVMNICLNIFLILKIGTLGAAIATAFSFFVMWIMRYVYAKRYIPMDKSIVKQIVSYIILVIQIVVEHIYEEFLPLQILFIGIVALLYIKELKWACNITQMELLKAGKRNG